MPRKTTEFVSPSSVYNRVVFGLLVAGGAYFFWSPTPSQENIRLLIIGIGIALTISGWRAVKNPLLAIRYAYNPERVVANLIRDWKPESARLESDYEKSLYRHLLAQVPFVKITRQYGSARVKCDIAVGRDVMIELKVGFRSTQKLQRLIGQIDLFRREWEKPVVVVLIGETQQDVLHDLHRTLRDYKNIEVLTKEVHDATPVEEQD